MSEAPKAHETDSTTVWTSIAFFMTAIKCGEPWTDACEEKRREAWEALSRLRGQIEPLPPGQYRDTAGALRYDGRPGATE